MESKRKEVEAFLREKTRGNWPFMTIVELNAVVGTYPKDELNEMLREGLIKRRQGVNGILIEVTTEGMESLRNQKPLVTEIDTFVK